MKAIWKAIFALLILWPVALHAQFIGYTSPQTVQQTLATNVACTGALQNFSVQNLGQTQHSATITFTVGNPTKAEIFIRATDTTGNSMIISDFAVGSAGVNQTQTLNASGYYPLISIGVNCSPGTSLFTLSYVGSSSTPVPNTGTSLLTQTVKSALQGVSAGAVSGQSFTSPFGTSDGQIVVVPAGALPAGSSVAVLCTDLFANSLAIYTFNLATAGTQLFPVPPNTCPNINVTYTNGGASASSVTVEYLFYLPGKTANGFSYTHVTGTTATVAKASPSVLHNITVNTGGAGTLSVFDLAPVSCTGTPATNIVAVITVTATTLQTFTYDTNFVNGICVKASAAMDFTVSSQ